MPSRRALVPMVLALGCLPSPLALPATPDVVTAPDVIATPDVVAAPDVLDATTPTDAPADLPPATDVPAPHDVPRDAGAPADVPPPFDPAVDLAALTAGVRTINLGSSLASALVVHGPTAFPVVHDANGATFIAAARAGRGAVVEYGHESLANDPANASDDRGALLRNVIRWMTGGATGAAVGYEGSRNALRDFLRAEGYAVSSTGPAGLDGIRVWVTDAAARRTPDEVARILAWVRAGGGLVVTGHAWYWGYSNTDAYNNFPGNQLLNPLGITVTTDPDPTNNTPVPVRAPTALEHSLRALERVRDHTRGGAPRRDALGDRTPPRWPPTGAST